MVTKRIFIAYKINFDKNLLNIYNRFMNEFSSESIKWINSDNIHLTIKFIGDTEIQKIDKIVSVLEDVAQNLTPFNLIIRNAGVFNDFINPKVLWFGIDHNKNLNKIFMSLNELLEELGIEKENKDFKPHITIGRIKSMNNKTNFKKFVSFLSKDVYQEFVVNNIELYESILTSNGSIYKSIRKFNYEKSE
jgi:2'-5' RNA ligase